MANQEIKKMKQGMSYSCKEKTIILNVFKYFCKEFPDKCVTELVRRTAKATGCSEKSIFQFRKEEASAEGFKQPSKTKIRKNININSRDIKYDDGVRQAIRTIIYDLKYRNVIPSLSMILKNIKADSTLPSFSLMTLRRLLFDMGFSYEKAGNKFILVEKDDKKNAKTNNDSKPDANVCQNQIETNRNEVDNRLVPQYPSGSNNIPTLNTLNDVNNINHIDNMKQMPPPMQQTNSSMPLPHINSYMLDPQPRLMPMHMTQHEQHMMPPQMHHTHTMPMMMNHNMPMQHHHRLPPPTNGVDMPWLPHHNVMAPQNIMK